MKVMMPSTDTSAQPNPVSNVLVGTGELWGPYRDIQDLIERAVTDATPQNFTELEETLKLHKPDFINLLSTKPRSPADRDELKKGATEGIYLRGHESKKVLQASIIHESIIMSDMFEINEFQALDLLTISEIEQECHPGWGRGLLAVYMFYEGRAALVSSFVSLLQAIPGSTWSSRVPRKVVDLFQNFLNQVFQEDMIDRILGLLSKHKVKPQIEMLDSNLALGDWRHRVNVIGFIEKIREGLAQIIFCWSAQHGLAWKDALRILEYLKTNLVLTDEFELEKEDVLLITSLLYAIDYSSSSTSSPNRTFAVEMKKYCTENDFSNGFQCVEILDLLKLTYFTNTYKLINETHITSVQNVPSYQLDPLLADINEEDDFEFRKDLFNFLRSFLFTKRDLFAEEEHIYRRYHLFFTDFITYLPLKVKDLKNRCEDAAKTVHLYNEQGLVQPPNLPQDYENFLECMSLFYTEDRFTLSSDYFSNEIPLAYLNKLVRSATVDYPFMFIHNVKMLTGLAKGCPAGVFNMLKMNGHYLSLEHFFDSIIKYLASFGNQVNFNGPSLYTSDTYQRVVLDSMKMTVNPAEIQGICVYLDMIEALCQNSDAVKFYFTTTKSQWLKVAVTAAKVRSIPREIRSKMLNAAAAMISKDQIGVETSMNLWEMFYSTRLIDYGSGDLRDELEDKEARLESYSLTIGLLKLINSLIEARFSVQDVSPLEINLNSQIDNGVLQPYVSFVRDAVLLKVGYRSYKSIVERWELATLALGIVSKLLDYVPTFMLQMLSDSPLHRMCLGALVDCMRLKEMSVGWAPHVDKCSLQCLSLIQRVLQRQHAFLFRRELSSGKQGTVVVGLHQLIMKVLPDSGRPDYLLAVVKFIDLMYPDTHRHLALDILSMIISGHGETDSHVYAAIISEPTVAAILRQTLCELLDDPDTNEDDKKLILKLMRSSIIHPSPNIALYLLGADKKVDFQNPGVQNYPRTLLHAILDNATTTPEAFVTLLMLIRDSRLASSLLRYLRTIQYFVKILMKEFPYPQMQFQCVGHFLKCVALELNNTKQPGPLAHILVGQERGKFQDILERIEMQLQSLEIPNLEFFDPAIVIQAMKTCEYHDRELNTKIVRLDVLESLLREEISKLEKGTVLRLRKSVHSEAKELIGFARELNAARQREASKVLMFDGWKQCLEILLLNPAALKLAGVDFVTSILRLILDKVRSTVGPSEYFLRLAAETTLTLCAVMHKLHPEVKGSTLNVILNHLCAWVPEEQHAVVRTYLYGAIHYVVDMLRDLDGATTNQSSFSQIIDHLCRDVSQSSDFGRLQAMYLVGEIIRWTHSKSLGGHEITTVPSSTSATTIANVSRLGRTSYQGSFVESSPRPPRLVATSGLNRVSSPTRTYLFDNISNVGSQRSFLETTSTPRRPIESRQFTYTSAHPTSTNGYSQRSPFSNQGVKLSSTLHSVGESPKSLNASGFHLSSVLSPGTRSATVGRTETNNENSSESSGDEEEEEPRRKSLMDCTSQDIFDTSNVKLARERDDAFGKVTTMRKLSLASGTPLKKSMEAMSSFSSSQSTLITHMHTKGYLRGLVDALPLVDDASLIQLFSNQPSSTHMRSLLIFEGKMSLFCRIAWAGVQPTLYLVDVNAILRLADMTVFHVNFGDDEADTMNAMDQSLLTGFNDTITTNIPSRINRMETLFSSLLKFFISMVTSAPRNVMIVDQIWHFVTLHDAALANLISPTVIHQEEYKASAYFFTSLMGKIARKLPADAYKKKTLTYLRLIGILKLQAFENVSSENRMVLVHNALLFLFNFAFNTEAAKEEQPKKTSAPCRTVLTQTIDFTTTAGNLDDEISVGLILKLVRDSLNRIHMPNTIPTAKTMECHSSIVETGLTLAYFHSEIFIRQLMTQGAAGRNTSKFQQELCTVIEDYFAADLAIHKDAMRGNYTDMMLHRLRRLAHTP